MFTPTAFPGDPTVIMNQMMQMMPSMLGGSPPTEKPVANVLKQCLSSIEGTVDVIIDIGTQKQRSSGWWPRIRRSPMPAFDVADFVEHIASVIPDGKVHAVIVDGDFNGNQSRHYANIPTSEVIEDNPTTPAPVTQYTEQTFNGGRMVGFVIHQHYTMKLEPSLKQMLSDAYRNISLGLKPGKFLLFFSNDDHNLK